MLSLCMGSYGMTIYNRSGIGFGTPISICLCSRVRPRPIVIPSLVGSLLASKHYHSSSRRGSRDGSTLLARASCSSAGVWTIPALASSFTSAAAALACMRPSSANLRVKRAISESYTSHSGICRARESFGSFCGCNSEACQFLSEGWHELSTDSGRGRLSWPGGACLCYLNETVKIQCDIGCLMQLTPRFTLKHRHL